MDAGTSRVISFSFSNTLDNDINVTSITVSGIPSDWYALEQTIIPRLSKGTTEKVRLTLNVPVNATEGQYQIKLSATAKNLFSGATLNRFATVDMDLSSDAVQPLESVTVQNQEPLADTAAVENNITDTGPTGFLNMNSEYFPYMVLALGVALSLLIFLKRDAITHGMMKATGFKRSKDKPLKEIKKALKMPSLGKLGKKLGSLKKSRQPKLLDLKEEKINDLETEIKRDVKELQGILEAEKRLKKRK